MTPVEIVLSTLLFIAVVYGIFTTIMLVDAERHNQQIYHELDRARFMLETLEDRDG